MFLHLLITISMDIIPIPWKKTKVDSGNGHFRDLLKGGKRQESFSGLW